MSRNFLVESGYNPLVMRHRRNDAEADRLRASLDPPTEGYKTT